MNKAQSGSTSNIFDACAEAMVPEVGARGWVGDRGGPARRQRCPALSARPAPRQAPATVKRKTPHHLFCATCACPFACGRLLTNVPGLPCLPCCAQDASIVIVEFALNDGTQAACKGDGSGTVPARASFERLLRKLQVGGRAT